MAAIQTTQSRRQLRRRDLLATAAGILAIPAGRAVSATRGKSTQDDAAQRARDPELLALIERFERAEREADRLDTLAWTDEENDELRADADAAEQRRLDAADALCQALRTREVAAGNIRQHVVLYRGRVYSAELSVESIRDVYGRKPPVHYLAYHELVWIAED